MADFFDCTNLANLDLGALINAMIVELPDGTKAIRTVAVAADCGTASDAKDCANNGTSDAFDALRSVIGIDACGKPAIRLAISS